MKKIVLIRGNTYQRMVYSENTTSRAYIKFKRTHGTLCR